MYSVEVCQLFLLNYVSYQMVSGYFNLLINSSAEFFYMIDVKVYIQQ